MRAGKDVHGLVKRFDVLPGGVLGRLALVVNDGRGREVVVLPARLLDAVAQVDVFAVHEVGFVKTAELVEDGLSYHHPGSAVHVDFGVLILGEVAQVVAGESRAARKKTAQSQQSVEGHARGGQCAFGFGEEFARSVDHAAPEGSDFRVSGEVGQRRGEVVFRYHGVGVEVEHHVAGCFAKGEVVRASESKVGGGSDPADLRELRGDPLAASVRGRVVDHDDFDVQITRRGTH